MNTAHTASRDSLTGAFNALLQPERFKDYGPNGLQVEGKAQVRHIVSGVTASLALIDAAIAHGADAIFVHHGLFWRGQDGRVVGWMKQRLQKLLAHDINLYAYHLPLDAHPTLGNNAQLGRVLGFTSLGGLTQEGLTQEGLTQGACAPAGSRFGEQDLGWLGTSPLHTLGELVAHVQTQLNRQVISVIPNGFSDVDIHKFAIKKIAWCTGGAQGYFESAIAAGADVFITGEISEPQAHYAHEMGVAFIACGHHASERYGAPAVAAHISHELGIAHTFIDIDNPA